ncbi:hypothetical protein [Helicobacter sp. MIT 14-3879]|uniref:hypothetical protein n=1 Tax=Helicobacter sp. MIT 14-3879 TaxID=2040649 RepID=UPI000E1F2A39|nr:hypothetical protein [Helicobacter sp. MIT 14-3879]RDU62617.1 hypothetical protein CQA44_06430 [Helicobacter sp. MIT 14-3879]
MKKLIILFFSILILKAELLGEITLKKDEIKSIDFFVENTKKTLSFRWTLYKDRGLVIHLNYDRNPHQFILYKENLNSYKINLSSIAKTQNPYFIIYFIDYNNDKKEAKFRYYLFSFNNNIEPI